MDTLKELLHSLNAHVRERISNPLYGAFIVSWTVFNYRLLLVLAGDGGFQEKIKFIDSVLYPTAEQSFHRGFVHPLLVAAVFVLLAPLVRRWIAVFTGERDAVTTAELLRVAGKTPLSPEKADALRQNLLDERRRRIDEKRALEGQVAELNAQVDVLLKNLAVASLVPRSAELDSTEVEFESPLSTGDAASDQKVFLLKENDFVGGAPKYVIKLGQSGLPVDFARALYAVRNKAEFDHFDIKSMLNYEDAYMSQVIVDKLLGLGLIESTMRLEKKKITSLGRQALAAVMGRGFNPT